MHGGASLRIRCSPRRFGPHSRHSTFLSFYFLLVCVYRGEAGYLRVEFGANTCGQSTRPHAHTSAAMGRVEAQRASRWLRSSTSSLPSLFFSIVLVQVWPMRPLSSRSKRANDIHISSLLPTPQPVSASPSHAQPFCRAARTAFFCSGKRLCAIGVAALTVRLFGGGNHLFRRRVCIPTPQQMRSQTALFSLRRHVHVHPQFAIAFRACSWRQISNKIS